MFDGSFLMLPEELERRAIRRSKATTTKITNLKTACWSNQNSASIPVSKKG